MCVPVSPSSALLKRINMLALHQVSAPDCVQSNDDNNNTCLSPTALKALKLPKPGLRRCLFGVPSAEDNSRIIQEDRQANRARMMKLWSWDVAKDAPETSGSWAWEKVKPIRVSTPVSRKSIAPNSELRHHPYLGALRIDTGRTSSETLTTIDLHVPPMISPIPPTPVVQRVRTTSTSSTLSSGDEHEVESSDSSTLSPPSTSSESWTSPRFATQISCSVKVQTRLTDFWRTRRSSCSESRHVKSPALAIEKNIRSGEMACSV